MIFAFDEDGTVKVYGAAEDAIPDYEGIDVESGVVHFYDESGTYLEPRFRTPNRKGQVFGVFGWVVSGEYDLVPNPSAETHSFALALYEARAVEPNPWFSTLEHLKSVLSARGVPIDLPPPRT